MNKKLLTLAVVAGLAAPMAASADAVMYGKVRLAVESADMGGADWARIQSYASRVGIKGSEDLGDGLSAVYKLEFGVRIADTDNEFSGGSSISNRNAYVGLKGGWGTLVLGRHDTPMKMSTGVLDYFGDTAGDNNPSYTENLQDRRANGTIAYITPSMGGLSVAAAIIPGENSEADGLADAYSVAAMYKNSGIYASAAIEGGDKDIDALGGAGDLTQTRFGLGYDSGSWKIGGVYENVEVDNDVLDRDAYAVNAAFKFGNNVAKVKYFDVEDSHDGFAVGLDHNLSKRTQAYLIYTDSSMDSGDDTTIYGVGLNHNF